jgi:L-ascorbate metabolism protein UlaG (beta-lactamase superfamily)
MVWRVLAGTILVMIALLSWSAYDGPVSSHFDGSRFYNPGEPFEKSFGDIWRFYRERKHGKWTRVKEVKSPPPPASVGNGGLRLTFIGHATTLIQVDGQNILTDPVWAERASPVSFAGPQRYVPPGIDFDDLPRIDIVVISHDHYDHLDLATLQRLRDHFDPVFVVGLGQSELLHDAGIERTVELDWWQPWAMPNGCKLWGAQAKHWTGRTPLSRNHSLWMSYVIETDGGPVYFAGDTGYGPHFRAVRDKFGPMRLALLPIGAYMPRWFMSYQHMDPAEAVQAHLDLGAASSLAIHFGTFDLSDEGQTEPVRALAVAREARDVEEKAFRAPEFGGGYDVPPLVAYPGCLP